MEKRKGTNRGWYWLLEQVAAILEWTIVKFNIVVFASDIT